MGDYGRILLLGVGLTAHEQDARLPQFVSDLVDSGEPTVTQKRDLAITEHLASPTRRRAVQGRRRADETKSGLGHAFGRYSTSPSRLPPMQRASLARPRASQRRPAKDPSVRLHEDGAVWKGDGLSRVGVAALDRLGVLRGDLEILDPLDRLVALGLQLRVVVHVYLQIEN